MLPSNQNAPQAMELETPLSVTRTSAFRDSVQQRLSFTPFNSGSTALATLPGVQSRISWIQRSRPKSGMTGTIQGRWMGTNSLASRLGSAHTFQSRWANGGIIQRQRADLDFTLSRPPMPLASWLGVAPSEPEQADSTFWSSTSAPVSTIASPMESRSTVLPDFMTKQAMAPRSAISTNPFASSTSSTSPSRSMGSMATVAQRKTSPSAPPHVPTASSLMAKSQTSPPSQTPSRQEKKQTSVTPPNTGTASPSTASNAPRQASKASAVSSDADGESERAQPASPVQFPSTQRGSIQHISVASLSYQLATKPLPFHAAIQRRVAPTTFVQRMANRQQSASGHHFIAAHGTNPTAQTESSYSARIPNLFFGSYSPPGSDSDLLQRRSDSNFYAPDFATTGWNKANANRAISKAPSITPATSAQPRRAIRQSKSEEVSSSVVPVRSGSIASTHAVQRRALPQAGMTSAAAFLTSMANRSNAIRPATYQISSPVVDVHATTNTSAIQRRPDHFAFTPTIQLQSVVSTTALPSSSRATAKTQPVNMPLPARAPVAYSSDQTVYGLTETSRPSTANRSTTPPQGAIQSKREDSLKTPQITETVQSISASNTQATSSLTQLVSAPQHSATPVVLAPMQRQMLPNPSVALPQPIGRTPGIGLTTTLPFTSVLQRAIVPLSEVKSSGALMEPHNSLLQMKTSSPVIMPPALPLASSTRNTTSLETTSKFAAAPSGSIASQKPAESTPSPARPVPTPFVQRPATPLWQAPAIPDARVGLPSVQRKVAPLDTLSAAHTFLPASLRSKLKLPIQKSSPKRDVALMPHLPLATTVQRSTDAILAGSPTSQPVSAIQRSIASDTRPQAESSALGTQLKSTQTITPSPQGSVYSASAAPQKRFPPSVSLEHPLPPSDKSRAAGVMQRALSSTLDSSPLTSFTLVAFTPSPTLRTRSNQPVQAKSAAMHLSIQRPSTPLTLPRRDSLFAPPTFRSDQGQNSPAEGAPVSPINHHANQQGVENSISQSTLNPLQPRLAAQNAAIAQVHAIQRKSTVPALHGEPSADGPPSVSPLWQAPRSVEMSPLRLQRKTDNIASSHVTNEFTSESGTLSSNSQNLFNQVAPPALAPSTQSPKRQSPLPFANPNLWLAPTHTDIAKPAVPSGSSFLPARTSSNPGTSKNSGASSFAKTPVQRFPQTVPFATTAVSTVQRMVSPQTMAAPPAAQKTGKFPQGPSHQSGIWQRAHSQSHFAPLVQTKSRVTSGVEGVPSLGISPLLPQPVSSLSGQKLPMMTASPSHAKEVFLHSTAPRMVSTNVSALVPRKDIVQRDVSAPALANRFLTPQNRSTGRASDVMQRQSDTGALPPLQTQVSPSFTARPAWVQAPRELAVSEEVSPAQTKMENAPLSFKAGSLVPLSQPLPQSGTLSGKVINRKADSSVSPAPLMTPMQNLVPVQAPIQEMPADSPQANNTPSASWQTIHPLVQRAPERLFPAAGGGMSAESSTVIQRTPDPVQRAESNGSENIESADTGSDDMLANQVNLLAHEVWFLLKRRFMVEKERMGLI